MAFWNETMDRTLNSLREQVREARKLQAVVDTYPARQRELKEALPNLEAVRKRTRKQADRRSRGGLWAFPHLTAEKQAETAKQAEQAALESDLAYETARQELDTIQREFPRAQARLEELKDCEEQFRRQLEQKAQRLAAMESAVSGRLEELDRKAEETAHRAHILRDALAAGQDVIPRLNRFVHRMYDFQQVSSTFIMTAEKSYRLERARKAFQASRDLLDVYCAPDFPSPVSEELKAACTRWCLRTEKLLWQTHHMDIFLDDIRALMTQAENLRDHIRNTFPQLEIAVEESAAAAVRSMERREDFICVTPAPGPGSRI